MRPPDDDKPSLTPKLRFPEFNYRTGWRATEVTNLVASISNGLSLPQRDDSLGRRVTRIETIADESIDLNRVGYVDAEADIEEYKLNVGDILVSHINSVVHIGKSAFIDRDDDLYHGMNLLRLVVDAEVNCPRFLFYSINTPAVRSSLRARANKAVNQASINQTELGRTLVPAPERDEQQKIADCLTSLDEVIAAQGRNVEALKAHKKGLMQHLFPQEGQTLPRLRFPEFRDRPEWEQATVGSRSKSFSGGTPTTTNRDYYGGTIPFIRSAEIAKDSTELTLTEYGLEHSAAKMVQRGDVLVALYGANSGDVALSRIDGAINQAILCLRPAGSREFLYHALTERKEWILSTFLQGGQGNLSGDIVKSIPLCLPSPEEQKAVGCCLSSIDELIEAAMASVSELRRHKAGLMQQLFPQITSD